MILEVWSSLENFKEVRLDAGLNIVLADRAEDSDETESTNGLGKTTLLRTIHFCLGSDLSRDKVLSHPDLKGVTFGITYQWNDQPVRFSRNTAEPKTVRVSAGFLEGLSCTIDSRDGDYALVTIEEWRAALTQRFYPGPARSTNRSLANVSFREIAGYLIRVGKPAFVDPQVTFSGQPGASKRQCVTFLLGLNTELQATLQADLASQKQVKEAIKALSEISESSAERGLGEMEADRVALEARIAERRVQIESFNVREDYREQEQRLTEVDREMHGLINENHSDRRLKEFYEASTKELPAGDPERPLQVLQDAGAVFKPEALRDIAAVSEFHRQLYRNRREFLHSEIERLASAIANRNTRIETLAEQKQSVLRLLKSSGAIDTLIELQRGFSQLEAEHKALLARIEERQRFNRQEDELSLRIARNRSVLRQDLDDRREAVDQVRALFANYTRALYGEPGRLSVDVGREGYSFSFTINRQGSDGVDQMVVFCFDLVVASLWAEKKRGFPVLIHDSTLFADVDPRQHAAALKLAADVSARLGFQYICCQNTGSLPRQHLGDIDVDAAIKVRLTDDGPQGRLLGRSLPPRDHRPE